MRSRFRFHVFGFSVAVFRSVSQCLCGKTSLSDPCNPCNPWLEILCLIFLPPYFCLISPSWIPFLLDSLELVFGRQIQNQKTKFNNAL